MYSWHSLCSLWYPSSWPDFLSGSCLSTKAVSGSFWGSGCVICVFSSFAGSFCSLPFSAFGLSSATLATSLVSSSAGIFALTGLPASTTSALASTSFTSCFDCSGFALSGFVSSGLVLKASFVTSASVLVLSIFSSSFVSVMVAWGVNSLSSISSPAPSIAWPFSPNSFCWSAAGGMKLPPLFIEEFSLTWDWASAKAAELKVENVDAESVRTSLVGIIWSEPGAIRD
ncbi:DEBR0S6_03158g1_1 [Brettanomyces bruxellensis]|uniref:DEBR0S6_03158g1_1 n=1 Tax=Dekkera bruxellensis TaxID=5007 RepID=A0A7D9CZX1_DEKBR|nr:DEBR0S6_03158g1_1 [Brettanomyces bruxellensis]